MAHELDMTNGKAAIALRGGAKSAWHGLGQEINDGDSIEVIQRKAGLDWEAKTAALEYTTDDGDARVFKGQQVIYRSDTGDALSTTSDNRYKIVQPRQVMEFFKDFLSENGLSIETAGGIRGGRVIWCLAKLGPDFGFLMPGKDKIEGYVRLQTSFDKSRATDLVATTIRQVCANTMRMVDNVADSDGYRVSHSQTFDAKALQSAFGFLGEQHRMTAELWNQLTKRKVSDKEAEAFFCDLYGIEPGDIGKTDKSGAKIVSTRTENQLRELAAAFKNGPGASLKSANGTAFGLLNAVTYWVDHQSSVVDTHKDGKQAARINSAWFGTGATMKENAEWFAAKLAGCESLLEAA